MHLPALSVRSRSLGLPVHIALSYTVLINLAWTMWGMYLFAKSWGFRISSALAAALGFGFGGAMAARVSHPLATPFGVARNDRGTHHSLPQRATDERIR